MLLRTGTDAFLRRGRGHGLALKAIAPPVREVSARRLSLGSRYCCSFFCFSAASWALRIISSLLSCFSFSAAWRFCNLRSMVTRGSKSTPHLCAAQWRKFLYLERLIAPTLQTGELVPSRTLSGHPAPSQSPFWSSLFHRSL